MPKSFTNAAIADGLAAWAWRETEAAKTFYIFFERRRSGSV
jgi:hypothetical protein